MVILPKERLRHAALFLAGASAVTDLVSIFACHTLLIAATLALLLSRPTLRFPPVMLPLLLFMAGTVISMLLDDEPSLGLKQVKKFFVFLMLIVVYNTFRKLREMFWLAVWWTGAATAQALWSFYQYVHKQAQAAAAGRDFYEFYVANRTTGFLSHWMSFSAVQMFALFVVLSVLFFWPPPRKVAIALAAGAVLILISIVLGDTRSVWLATAGGLAFLVWMWRPKMLLLLPVLAAAGLVVAPVGVRERVKSIYQPHSTADKPNTTLDSNLHRYVTMRTGIAMIQAHPWFGLGPEIVNRDFRKWVPPDIPRPLPDGYYGHLHSIYIHYAAERGIPTMLMMMWFLVKIVLDFLRGLRPASAGQRAFLCAGIAVVIGILLEGFFELNLGDSEPLGMFLAVVACGYVALAQEPEPEEICLQSC
ncbi:MAG: O-antigen ligase family protein [Bryobacteraceae bacterium]